MRGLGKILGTRRQEVIFYSDFNDIARFEQHLDLPIDNKDMGFWEIDQIIQAPVPLAQVPPDEGLPGGVEGGESVPPDPTGREAVSDLRAVTGEPQPQGNVGLFLQGPVCQAHRSLSEITTQPLEGWREERLRHPDLLAVDRRVLEAYQPGTSTEEALRNHYVALLDDVSNRYTGWEDDRFFAPIRRLVAFEQALEVVVGFDNGEACVRDILAGSYSHWSQGMDALLAGSRVQATYAGTAMAGRVDSVTDLQGLSDDDFQLFFLISVGKLLEAPMGPGLRQELFRLKIFLYAEMARRGIDADQIGEHLTRLYLQGLREEDYRNFLGLESVAASLETTDDQEARDVLLQELAGIHERLQQQEDPQSNTAVSLYSLSLSYVELGRQMGIPLSVLEEARGPLVPVASSILASHLPSEVGDVFRLAGFEGLLLRHGQETVILADDINEAGASFVVSDMRGRSIWFEGVTFIDQQAQDRNLAPWEIASFLVHEWTHGDWVRRHFDRWPELLRSIPNERAAYIAQRDFLVVLRDLGETETTPIPGYDHARIEGQIREIEGRLRVTNHLLGYAEGDWTQHPETYPPVGQLPGGVPSLRELELDVYPRARLLPSR
ncbi:MAG: hypothetical protein A3F89_01805 [Deltaproteobacteria bacterium RIFCSPLOWO2_12_FULL_50_11]|nr:MAG: hypothetical protein A3F89_01805 [Deltaproteobacteria bacterium RIFCSPLOWO2_12_FULL_50_11]